MVHTANLNGLIKYAGRDEWREHLNGVMSEHFEPLQKDAGFDFREFFDLIGAQGEATLWGCAFEDFLTRRFDTPGENIVDVYLKRRGWRETALNKAYIKALRDSAMSLYEVTDIVPGESARLHDLIRGGDPLTIVERTATRSLQQWDRIAARVVEVRGENMVSGCVLAFSFEACTVFFDALETATGYQRFAENGQGMSDAQLQELSSMFTCLWICNILDSLEFRKNPVLRNSDGDLVEYHDLVFAFAPRVTQKDIASHLNERPELVQENKKFWNWIEVNKQPEREPGKDHASGLTLETTVHEGSRVLGNVELKGRTLLLAVNSAARAKRGQDLIENLLGDLVRSPRIEIKSVRQMIDDTRSDVDGKPQDTMPPDIAAQHVRELMDQHYMRILDEAIPTLDNMTPRQAAKTRAGRQNVIEWLKHMENSSMKANDFREHIDDYDFGWVWEELGIERPSTRRAG